MQQEFVSTFSIWIYDELAFYFDSTTIYFS